MDRKGYIVMAVAVLIIASAAVVIVMQTHDTREVSFTIVHTNDSHCRYDSDGTLGFQTVSALKKELSKEGPLFTVDAGDFLQGNACGIVTEGEASVEVMNTVGYDVGVPGNHDFDYGLEALLQRASELNFPLICANLVYEDTGMNVFPGYLIIEREGIRVGFFGLLTEETPRTAAKGYMGDTTVTSSVEAAENMVSILKKEHVDCIVCIGHLGIILGDYPTSDEVCSKVEGIDIFIDGHSHTEMEDGRICDGSRELIPSDTVIACAGKFINSVGVVRYSSDGISAKLYRGPALSDAVTEEAVRDAIVKAQEKLDTVVGSTEVQLVGQEDIIWNETNLGDLVTDIVRLASGCQVTLLNSGGFSKSIDVGLITIKEVFDMYPYQNNVCILEVSGSDLWQVMEISLSKIGNSDGGFLQFSGMTVTYDPESESGHRLVSIKVGDEDIEMDSTYTLSTSDYVYKGGCGYGILTKYDADLYDTVEVVVVVGINLMGTITESDIIGNRLLTV